MRMEGDGPEGQPADGVVSIDDVADAMIGEEETAQAESDESEESDQAEGSEAEEEEAGEEAEDEQEEDPTVTLKHDGKDVTLKQSEVIELAQKGFDYTQKTMAVAKERDEAKAMRTQAEELHRQGDTFLQEQANRAQAMAHFAQAMLGEPPPASLLHQNVAEYLAQKEHYESRQGQLRQALSAVEQFQEEAQRRRQAQIARDADATEKALRDTLPGWNDDMLAEYAKYADGLGLNPGTAEAAFVQQGFWTLIHKAKQFDAIQAKKAELKPKAQLTKVAKPSAQNQPAKAVERAKREAAFNKNPSVDSLADFLR